MNVEHFDLIHEKDFPELSDVITKDMRVIDYDDGKLHCTELFTHEGAYRGYANTKEESLHKAVEQYKKEHKVS